MIRALGRRVRATAHGVTDELLTRAMGGPKLYADGFGSLEELDALVETVRSYDASEPPARITMQWERSWTSSRATVRVGTFKSPAASMLPLQTRRASVEFHEPLRDATGQVCLLLAATGEEGYPLRRRLVGDLLSEGIGEIGRASCRERV